MRRLITGTVFSLTFLVSAPGVAQDYFKGVDAYDRGDFATALKEWKPLAEKGGASLQSDLGDLYRLGKGVPQDYAKAMKWYRKAAEQGSEYSQNILGTMYGHGRGH
jgi:TPR repeat protein